MLRYGTNDPKVCKEVVIGRGKNLNIIYWSIKCLFDDLQATIGEYLQCMKDNTNEVAKHAVVLVRAKCHCKEEVVGPVPEKAQ